MASGSTASNTEVRAAALGPLPWLVLALAGALQFGPLLVAVAYPPRSHILDFFQDWSSARCYLAGRSIYTPLVESAHEFLGLEVDPVRSHLGRQSTHPPASVLLALPLAFLGYPEAFLVWNLLSLGMLVVSAGLIARELGPPWPGAGLAVGVAVALLASPLFAQVLHAQVNLFLLLLITLAWRASRREAWGVAGMLLGTAAAVKLMPAYLFLYLLVRRRWLGIVAGGLAFGLWNLVAWWLFGTQAFEEYQRFLLPHLGEYRSDWLNASLAGFSNRLFDVGSAGAQVTPLWPAPWLAKGVWLLGAVVFTGLAGWAGARAATARQRDAAFGLTITAMLLVSPFTWEHYLLLLLLPLWLVAQEPMGKGMALAFALVLVGLWVNPAFFWEWSVPPGFGKVVAQPWQVLTLIGVKFYAVLGLFVLQGIGLIRQGRVSPA